MARGEGGKIPQSCETGGVAKRGGARCETGGVAKQGGTRCETSHPAQGWASKGVHVRGVVMHESSVQAAANSLADLKPLVNALVI